MKPDPRFLKQPKHFWASVRSISEHVKYTIRNKKLVKAPNFEAVVKYLEEVGLGTAHIADKSGKPTRLGNTLTNYFTYRADVLNNHVEPRLMNAEKAFQAYQRTLKSTRSRLPVVMNKQKGSKKKPAYLTNIVNWLIDANSNGITFDHNPQKLTTFTREGFPFRTLARRVDGAFPSVVNPIALWEIKEYYHTTSFGSRVADAVYETILDGMELEELRQAEDIHCLHYLILYAREWWDKGRSYLCRIVDILHMGYVDEVLFGTEVLDRLPALATEWVNLYRQRQKA